MIPISDENPTYHTPYMTYVLLALTWASWILVQGAGLNPTTLAASVCNFGLVPGEVTGRAPLGLAVPIGPQMACVVDNLAINALTPVTSMFLHGGWLHIIMNSLFFWVFGNNIEDSMGHWRFLAFYLLCGLAAAGAHVLSSSSSPVPTVGASGAISGIMGAYLVLYPRVRVKLLVPLFILFFFIRVPAWAVLIYWFLGQVLTGVPQLTRVDPEISGGVAVWAHIGGFVAGVVLVKLFENREWVRRRTMAGDARAVWEPSR